MGPFCAIQELLSGQDLSHVAVDKLEIFPKLISNKFLTVYQISYGYDFKFLDYETLTFGKLII